MNNLDRMKLIKLGVKDLEEAVCAYEYARKKNPNTYDYLLELPNYHKRESIYRRIVQVASGFIAALGRSLNVGMPELKPCPFCGGEAVINSVFDMNVYFVHCKNCACSLARFYGDKCDAISEWNRRVNDENAG